MQNEKCKISRVGKRGTLFTFYDLEGLETNVYAIIGPSRVFVVDTFLGPASMAVVKRRLKREMEGKPVVVVNTHYHWDHVWGNCAFPGALVVGHARCRETMLRLGKKELAAYAKLRQGNVNIVFPDCTFSDRLIFEDDGVELFHSPGHSPDSIAVFDRADRVLLVGDNVEEPLPCLYSLDLEHFQQTLEAYLVLKAKRIIAGHCSKATTGLIKRNMDYLRAFRLGRTGKYERDPYRQTHAQNLLAMKTLRNI